MTLRCTIEIVPFGVEENKRQIFRFDITNNGAVVDGDDHCLYSVKVKNQDGELIRGYMGLVHRRSDGAVKLVKRALERFLVDSED